MKYRIKAITSFVIITLCLSLFCACSLPQNKINDNDLITIEEIAKQTQFLNFNDYNNLELKETEFYIPNTNEIVNFSLYPIHLSVDEREKVLLETVEKFTGKNADINNILYLEYNGETLKYFQVKNNPERSGYFVKYQTSEYDIGINIPGNYIYARPYSFAKMMNNDNNDYWIEFGTKIATYNLRREIPDISIDLLNGAQNLSSIIDDMIPRLQNEFPFFNNQNLTIHPYRADIYKIDQKSGAAIRLYYEFENVPIDYCRSGYQSINSEDVCYKAVLNAEASSAYIDSIDELYGAKLYKIEKSNIINNQFISLNHALKCASEKLTGKNRFSVETVELCYGLTKIMTDEFYNNPEAKIWEYEPVRIDASPVWILTIPATGIAESPSVRVFVDALTGETEIYKYDSRS